MKAVRTHSFDGLDVLNMRISTWITPVNKFRVVSYWYFN